MNTQAGSIEGAPIPIAPIEDIMGPGNAREIKVKQEASEGGARISKNSKKIIFVIIGGLAVAILGGILAAGNGNKQKEFGGSPGEVAAVGRTPPPSPPAKQFTISNPFASAGDAASGVSDTSTLAGANKGLLSNQHPDNKPGLQGGQHELSPAEKHRKWLEEQKYKRIEGNILSADAAQESGFGQEANAMLAAQHLQSQASSNNALNGNLDAIRAAANSGNTSGIDPALLARLNAATGQVGAADPQSQNKSFIAENKNGDDGYLHALVEAPIGKHELLAGSIIPAVLITALNSDLPGFVTAMVRQTVYDSLNHRVVVIPQGSKLIGRYSSDVAFGQTRALIAWNRLIFPDGGMIDLQGMSGTDGQGQSGFEDQVDNHYTKIFGSSILMSILGTAVQLSQPANNVPMSQPTPQQQAAASLATGLEGTGNKMLEKNLGIQPTIKIRAGYLFNVMVNKTMIMPVWGAK